MTDAHLLPLSADGLVVVASVSLVEIAARLHQAAAPTEVEPSVRSPVTVPEPTPESKPEPEPVSEPSPEPEPEPAEVPKPRTKATIWVCVPG